VLLSACVSRYFHPAGPPPPDPQRHALGDLRWHEYWTGIIFNGDKVGFTHVVVSPVPDQPGRYRIHSEASLLIRLLGFGKKIQLRGDDIVNDDLTLVRFDYEYTIDRSSLRISGTQADGRLAATILNAGRTSEQVLDAKSAIYPSSVLDLYPVVKGLKLGAEYRYQVYSGETQSLLDVRQSVDGYETSDLFQGKAYKVRTSTIGHSATTWIDESGQPLLALALNGVMISALEGESEAKRYLALAALNKRDTLIDFSLIKTDRRIADPRRATQMTVAITGPREPPLATDQQRCEQIAGGWLCKISAAPDASSPAPIRLDLQPSVTVSSDSRAIGDLARTLAGNAATPDEQIRRLLDWIHSNIERAPVDSFSALDVLETKKAECQGHAYLYTALARALGIPTQVVNGVVYSEQFQGFLYHSWTRSYVDGSWRAVDPMFAQPEADATHIIIVDGESAADLLPLLEWVGKAHIRVVAVEPDASAASR